MRDSITIKPVSEWANLAKVAISEGCKSVGEFILACALCHIAIPESGMREVRKTFAEHQQSQPVTIVRGQN